MAACVLRPYPRSYVQYRTTAVPLPGLCFLFLRCLRGRSELLKREGVCAIVNALSTLVGGHERIPGGCNVPERRLIFAENPALVYVFALKPRFSKLDLELDLLLGYW